MPPRSRTPASVGSPRLGCSLPCLTRSPRSGRGSPLSSCVPCRLQPRGTEPQRRHPDQRQTGSTAPDCHRPMRTIWVYKGTPNPPVKPSGVLNRGIVFNPSRVAALHQKNDNLVTRSSFVGGGESEVSRLRSSYTSPCVRVHRPILVACDAAVRGVRSRWVPVPHLSKTVKRSCPNPRWGGDRVERVFVRVDCTSRSIGA